MARVVDQVQRVNELIAGITAASSHQTDNVARVHLAVGQLDRSTQHNAVRVQETAKAAGRLQ